MSEPTFPVILLLTSYITTAFLGAASHHLGALNQYIPVILKASVNAYKLLVSLLLLASLTKKQQQYAFIQIAPTSSSSIHLGCLNPSVNVLKTEIKLVKTIRKIVSVMFISQGKTPYFSLSCGPKKELFSVPLKRFFENC